LSETALKDCDKKRVLNKLEPGDVLLVGSLEQLGETIKGLAYIFSQLDEREIAYVSLDAFSGRKWPPIPIQNGPLFRRKKAG
jgi:hypothetical protein